MYSRVLLEDLSTNFFSSVLQIRVFCGQKMFIFKQFYGSSDCSTFNILSSATVMEVNSINEAVLSPTTAVYSQNYC